MKRAVRRHHRDRLIKARKDYHGGNYKGREQRLADTPTPCSCWMCRNARADYGPTIQERRNSQE